MIALEHEIVAKYRLLDEDAKARVRAQINRDVQTQAEFDDQAWSARMDALREEMRLENGGVFPQIDAMQMLCELRDGEDG